jgi:AAA domain
MSSKPVLQCLQSMPGVPLADVIVHGNPPAHTDYLAPEVVQEVSSQCVPALYMLSRCCSHELRSCMRMHMCPYGKATTCMPFSLCESGHAMLPTAWVLRDCLILLQELESLGPTWDRSQLAAMQQALTQQVALIQGPPGTGKTFAGVQLCDIILRSTQETVLCVCYTNHALDQFLEALLDKGITNVCAASFDVCAHSATQQHTGHSTRHTVHTAHSTARCST